MEADQKLMAIVAVLVLGMVGYFFYEGGFIAPHGYRWTTPLHWYTGIGLFILMGIIAYYYTRKKRD